MSNFSLPILSSDGGLSRYIQDVSRFPMLSEQEEFMLAKAFKDYGDNIAAQKLVTSHLRLVVKIAMGFKGYGISMMDLISEGNIGLITAVKKFNPDAGFRLSTYAMWWIKASIQEFVLRSWSLVKIGTTAAQKKLFFNLKKMKHRLNAYHKGDLYPEEVKKIASELNVEEAEVIEMDRRMSGADLSINVPISEDGEDEWGDIIEGDYVSQETAALENQEKILRQSAFKNALKTLNEREIDILTKRRIAEPAATLDELSKTYRISKERVRQIEERAFAKLQKEVVKLLPSN